MMNYAQLRKYDIANGVGVRTTLFVSGCHFHCRGCFNEAYQDFRYGTEFTDEVLDTVIEYVSNPIIEGLSILGGEPFDQDMQVIQTILARVKDKTEKNIWVWTGYTYDHIAQTFPEALQMIDVLVDGQFEIGKRDLRLKFRGSSNQRIIDIPASLVAGSAILYDKL